MCIDSASDNQSVSAAEKTYQHINQHSNQNINQHSNQNINQHSNQNNSQPSNQFANEHNIQHTESKSTLKPMPESASFSRSAIFSAKALSRQSKEIELVENLAENARKIAHNILSQPNSGTNFAQDLQVS